MNPKTLLALFALSSLTLAVYGADFDQAVNELIPKLADAEVRNRYAAQMQLQDLMSAASKPGSDADRLALAKALAGRAGDSSVPQPARVWIVRQLEHLGRGEAVAALTQVLNGDDAELRECARRALEKNPDAQAGASLRAALEKAADATRKIGLINSLGERRDAASVKLIAAQLNDPTVGPAAAKALGQIASPSAVDALWFALKGNRFAGEALIDAANNLAASKTGGASAVSAAKAIYQRLYAANVPNQIRGAALMRLTMADSVGVERLLADALTGNDSKLRNAAVTAVTEYWYIFDSSNRRSEKIVALLPRVTPAIRARLLGALNASAEKDVMAAVADPDESVRRAAIETLGRVGSGASVPVLLAAATDEVNPGKSTAVVALAKIKGTGAADAIRQAAGSGSAKARAAAIGALAARRDTGALPSLLQYAADSDAAVRKAAFVALGKLGTDSELDPLARMTVSGKSPEAATALEALASRSTDKASTAKKLLAAAGADEQAQAAILQALSVLGGEDALTAVTKLTGSADKQVREDAIRALGEWSDFAAVKPLQAIAGNKDTPLNLYALAMQGIARLVKSSESEPAPNRVDAAVAALESARRDDEKKMVLSALGAVPHVKAAGAIKPLLADPNLKKEAGAAAMALAESLRRTDRKTARDLAQAVKDANISDSLNQRADRLLTR